MSATLSVGWVAYTWGEYAGGWPNTVATLPRSFIAIAAYEGLVLCNANGDQIGSIDVPLISPTSDNHQYNYKSFVAWDGSREQIAIFRCNWQNHKAQLSIVACAQDTSLSDWRCVHSIPIGDYANSWGRAVPDHCFRFTPFHAILESSFWKPAATRNAYLLINDHMQHSFVPLESEPHTSLQLAPSPDGKFVAFMPDATKVTVLDVNNGSCLLMHHLESPDQWRAASCHRPKESDVAHKCCGQQNTHMFWAADGSWLGICNSIMQYRPSRLLVEQVTVLHFAEAPVSRSA